MKISEAPEFKKEIIQKIHDKEFTIRTGVHCSDLIYCLNRQALRRLCPQPPQEHEILLFSIGWSTQRWLTGKDSDAEEKIVDGITVTCDDIVNHFPWELKSTYSSSEQSIEENDSWLKQIMAQCYVQKQTKAYLTRLELMGNWKSVFGKKDEKEMPENRKPTLHAYFLEFDQEELDANWLWLRRRADRFKELINVNHVTEMKLLPPIMALPEKHEWECKYCLFPYKKMCGVP